MAVAWPGFKLPLVAACGLLLGVMQNVAGSGHIEIWFIRYSDNCKEHLGFNECDPMFSFCLSTPQTGSPSVDGCNYASTGESGHFQDVNRIEMESLLSIQGHRNPWIVQVDTFLGPSVMLVLKVRDKDIVFHDHLQTWAKTLTETIWPTKEQSSWVQQVMISGSYTMVFRVRMYCDPYYYTTRCNKYCKPEDSSSGHYICDSVTGDKICLPGWKGPECLEDIDECSLGYCVRGECNNLPGDYACKCPGNYTGKNCSELMNACRSQPCQNNGSCYAHLEHHEYVCRCTPEWEGINCEKEKVPCLPNPCQNNGSCTSSSDKTNYSCSCVYPYAGHNCETDGSSSSSLETSSGTSNATTASTMHTSTESTTLSKEFQDANMQQMTQKDDDSGFQLWYIAFILAAFFVLTVLAVFFIRRRKQKAKETMLVVAAFDGSHLAFENGMYTNANRSNSEIERQTRQLPPVPVISTISADDELFNPTKPAYKEVNETEGAAGGHTDVNSDLKTKSSTSLVKASNPAFGSLDCPANERAQTNPYADFKSLRDLQNEASYPDNDNHNEESHYHDLEDIASSVQHSNDVDDPDESSNGTFNYTIQDTPIVAILGSPYNIPSNSSSIYSTPQATSLIPDCKDSNLTLNSSLPNNLTPRTDNSTSADDLDTDSGDEDISQEDLAQLRKSVKDNMTTFETSVI